MYWIDVCREMEKYVIGALDIRDMDSVESGSISPGVYKIWSSGSFYAEWTGDEWLNQPRLETEIRKAYNRKHNIEGDY